VGQLQLFQVNIYTCYHLKTGHKIERRKSLETYKIPLLEFILKGNNS